MPTDWTRMMWPSSRLETAMRRLMNVDFIQTIYVQGKSNDVLDQAEIEIRELLRRRHRLDDKPDDFTIQNQAVLLETERETAQSMTLLIGSVSGISLIVGGVGILAVMLISVRERTGEIGLRRAIGARRCDIRNQFLLESGCLPAWEASSAWRSASAPLGSFPPWGTGTSSSRGRRRQSVSCSPSRWVWSSGSIPPFGPRPWSRSRRFGPSSHSVHGSTLGQWPVIPACISRRLYARKFTAGLCGGSLLKQPLQPRVGIGLLGRILHGPGESAQRRVQCV